MAELADFSTLYETAMSLNNMAVTLQRKNRYLLAHQTLKDAMLCMQLILRPTEYPVWPTVMDVSLKVTVASERIRLVEEQAAQPFPRRFPDRVGTNTSVDASGPDLARRTSNSSTAGAFPGHHGPSASPIVDPISIEYTALDHTGVDINSAIIVFNFGLTYLGLTSENCPKNRRVLYEAAVELFYLSYSILVKLSVETEELDFCEYILILSMKMLSQTIGVDAAMGKDVAQLQKLLRNAEDSFTVLHQIGRPTVAAAA